MPRSPKRPAPRQRWITFVRNHAKATIASDFFVVVTATFQLVYVFLIMEVGTRRIRHVHVTRHPTAEWTLQQFREYITGGEGYKFIIHDRDDIYSKDLDASLKTFGLRVLRTPFRSPQANSFCERLIGSARRECLDFMIPLDEAHVAQIMKSWAAHLQPRTTASQPWAGNTGRSGPRSRTPGATAPDSRRSSHCRETHTRWSA